MSNVIKSNAIISNQKKFSPFFPALPKYTYNFQYLEKKDEPQRWFLSELISQINGVSNATNSNAIISNSKNTFSVLCCIYAISIKFGILWNKRWASENISFWNDRLQKACLLKCLKSLASEHLWAVNMLKCPKDALNLQSTIFVIFFDHSERESASNTLF